MVKENFFIFGEYLLKYVGMKYGNIYILDISAKMYKTNMVKSTQLLSLADECMGVHYAVLFSFL